AVAASSRSRAQCRGAPALSSSTAIAFANLCWSPVVHCMRMRAAVAAQYKFLLVGTVLALHSSLVSAHPSLPISRAISCHRCQLFSETETGSCAASTRSATSSVAALSPSGARCGGTAAPSSSVAMALASLWRLPVVHCTRMRAAVAAQYKFRLVGAVLAIRSSWVRTQSSLSIARAISCHRRHFSAGIETATCARSTTIAIPTGTPPFTANARPGRTHGAYTQFAPRRSRWQGSSRAATIRGSWAALTGGSAQLVRSGNLVASEHAEFCGLHGACPAYLRPIDPILGRLAPDADSGNPE